MLSFETTNSGRTIQIYCDKAGITTILKAIAELQSNGGHLHLRAPAAGGDELSDVNPWGERAVEEVILTTGGDD